MSTIEATAGKEAAVGKTAEPDQGRSSASRSYLLIAPSVIWMALFLVIPLAMIVYVSFWTQSTFKIEPSLTLDTWQTFFGSDTYLNSLWTTIRIWLIVLVSTFSFGSQRPFLWGRLF